LEGAPEDIERTEDMCCLESFHRVYKIAKHFVTFWSVYRVFF
jgi:hypothetical protein